MSSSSSSRSGNTPQPGDHESGKKKPGRPPAPCNASKGGCGRMPTEETSKECARCEITLRNRVDKQKERERNRIASTASGSSSDGAAKVKKTDGAQLVDQARQLAAIAMYQLAGCNHCSPVLHQLEAELTGLLGDLIEPDPSSHDVVMEDTEEGPFSSSTSAEAALPDSQVVATTEIYLPPQQLYTAASSAIQGQFGVYPHPTHARPHRFASCASTYDAAQMIAAPRQQYAGYPIYVPPLTTQFLAVDTTLAVDVTNAFDQRGLFPIPFFEGIQLPEALNDFEKEGKFFPFLTPANFRFVGLPSNRQNDVTKGRYTGFAVRVVIVDTGMTVKDALRWSATRRLLAPEILAAPENLADQSWTALSGSWSLYRMYYDALKSKMQLRQTTADNAYHFIENAVMKKGPMAEDGWWELNPHIVAALYGGLFADQQGQRLGIEAFVRLFQRTNDRHRRYIDSRICVDAFEYQQFMLEHETPWFRD